MRAYNHKKQRQGVDRERGWGLFGGDYGLKKIKI